MFSSLNSKRSSIFIFFFSIALLVFNSGCGQFFGEKPPVISSDQKIGFETQCLKNVLPVMKAFMAGTAQEEEIRGTWQCFGNGIAAFQKKVKGTHQNSYSAKELVKFFEDYFLAETKVSPELLQQVMYVKQVFVGGAADSVTREDLRRLVEFSQKMEDVSIDLLPYMKVYAMTWSPEAISRLDHNVQYFEDANLAMQKAVKDLAALIARNEHGYEMKNFVKLMREFEHLYSESWPWLNDVERLLPLIEKFKETLAGGDPGVIAASEWRRFALLGGRGFIQYLRYYYFIEKAEEVGGSQIVYLTSSVNDLFSYLGDMVKEKPTGVFTKQELHEVIKSIKTLFPKINISEELLTEVMKVKILFFGGSAESWTPGDFTNAQGKVHAFRSLAEHFMGYSDLYLMKWKPLDLPESQAQDYFQSAENNLKETSAILSRIIESQYNLQDIEKLSLEFDRLFPPVEGQPSVTARIRQYLPMVIAFKQIVLAENDALIRKEKWNDFILSSAEAYTRGLYAYYFLKDSNLFYSVGLHSLDKFTKKTTTYLTELIQKRPSGGQSIQYSEFDRLLKAFSNSGLWLKGLKVETAQSLIHVLFDRILLTPEKRLANVKPDGLSIEAIALLQSEYNLWSANQHFLEVLYQTPEQEYSTQVILDALQKAEQTEGTKELMSVFSSPIAMSIRENGLLEIKNQSSLYYLKSASMMNLARVASRAILRSYAMDMGRIQSLTGVTVNELDQVFQDIRPLVVELGLIEPDNVGFARSRFFEANLFTPTADGNDFMSFREGAHLVIMIFSGLELNKRVDTEIEHACQVKEGSANHFRDRTPVACAAQVYFHNRERFFSSMPMMKNYLMSLSQDDFNQMYFELLKATGWVPTAENEVMIGDLGLVPHIFQYLEMLMQRFDTDKSGILVDSEADEAYPIYGPLINLVSPTKIKMINRTAFFYLIKNGKIPSNFKEIMKLLKDVVRREFMHKPLGINTDRGMLAKVFGAIADAIRTSGLKKPKLIDPPKENENGIDVDGHQYQWEQTN